MKKILAGISFVMFLAGCNTAPVLKTGDCAVCIAPICQGDIVQVVTETPRGVLVVDRHGQGFLLFHENCDLEKTPDIFCREIK